MRTRALTAAAILIAATAGLANAASITVLAAASLTDAFTAIGRAFDRETGNRTTFEFAGSQALRAQIENGAPFDVFASADEAQYAPLERAALVEKGRTFAGNRLVVAAFTNGPVKALADLARPGTRLVIAEDTVPAGAYARRALELMAASGRYGPDFAARALGNVASRETNVRQVVLKVSLGEADAGIVYATDVTRALQRTVRNLSIPSRFSPPVRYPIGAARRAPSAARAFVAFVLGPQGQRILKACGFVAAGQAP